MGAPRPEATPDGIRVLAAAHERRLVLGDDDRWVVLDDEQPIDQLMVARLARRGMIEIGSNPGRAWGYHTTRLGDTALRTRAAARRGVAARS